MVHTWKRGPLRMVRNPSQHSLGRLVYCDCGTRNATRKLNRERFDALTIFPFIMEKDGSRGARLDNSEEQRAYYQAHHCSRKARKKKFDSILHCCQKCEIYRNLQMTISWTEEFCKHLDELAQEDHSYVPTWQRTTKIRKGMESTFEQPRG